MNLVTAIEQSAFRELYQRFERRLHRVAYATLLDHSEASDVVQEVFVRLHHQGLPTDVNVDAWLWRVTLNSALSWRRRLLRFGRAWSAPRPASADPEHALGIRQGLDTLRAAIRALPPKQRAVVALHLDAGLQPSEIAEALEITPNAARVTLHRALKSLQESLTNAGIDPGSLSSAHVEETT